jgi:hypothetical protein
LEATIADIGVIDVMVASSSQSGMVPFLDPVDREIALRDRTATGREYSPVWTRFTSTQHAKNWRG